MTASCKSYLVLAFLLSSILVAGGQTVRAPVNRKIALAGEIREVHGYGPPGYGENKKTDVPITYWVLELPNPINVSCAPEKPQWSSDDCRATMRLRLFFPTSPADNELERQAKAMKGHRVFATGILHRSDAVGEITPIYMDVTELQPVESSPKP